MKIFRVLFAALFATLFLSGCASAPSEPDPTPRPRPVDVTIEMSEYAFSPSEIEAEVGQEVTLTLVNVGELDHELMIGRDVEMHDGVPAGYEVDLFRTAGVIPTVEGDGTLMAHAEGGHQEEAGMDMNADDHEDDTATEDSDHEDNSMDMEAGDQADDMTMDLEGDGALMVMVPVGDGSTTETFTVTADMVGEWEMGCFQLDGVHYNSGMVGTFTVTD